MSSDASKSTRVQLIALWAGLLMAPLATLIQLQTSYSLVNPSCASGNRGVLHLVSLVAFMACTFGLVTASLFLFDKSGDPNGRTRFMAWVGTLLSALCALVVAAEWLAVFIYDPCAR